MDKRRGMYIFMYKFPIFLSIIKDIACLQYTSTNAGQWIPASDFTVQFSHIQDATKIVSFENQTVYLPCAMQSANIFQSTQDQLTLILWYRSWNTSGPPIYSIDFRNSKDYQRSRNVVNQHRNAVHFISNEQFKNRILFEFNTCWLNDAYQKIVWLHRPINMSSNHQLDYISYYDYQFNNSKTRFSAIRKPTCALLKMERIKQNDSGRYSCRMDFRRSRTLHTQLSLKVLEKPKHFEIRANERRLVNNSIIRDLNEGSSLTVHCSARLKENADDIHLLWYCNDKLAGLYSNESHFQSSYMESKLKVKHLYRIFNEKSCSCYIVSNFGQQLLHLQIHFQLHLAPISVSIIRSTVSLNLNKQNVNQEFYLNSSSNNSLKRSLKLDADQLTNLQCHTTGSRPAATCKWSLLNGYHFKSKDYSESTSIESVSTTNGDQLTAATVSTLSILHLLVTNQMDNQIIRCTCSNPLISPPIQLIDQIHIEVLSKPVLNLMFFELKNRTKLNRELAQVENFHQTLRYQVKEGDNVQLICDIVKSNPPLKNVQWFIDDIELENYKKIYPNATVEFEPADQLSLIIRNVDRKMIGRFFCMAENDKGKSQSNLIILDVQSAPFCRNTQKILYTVALGERVDVNCDLYADSMDPLLRFHWTLNKQPLPSTIYSFESITSEQLIQEQLKWRPLNSNESNESNIFNISKEYEINHQIVRSKLKFNSSNYQFEHATLACWATNSFGQQKEPCLFSLLAIGPPEVPKNCSIQYFELDEKPDERQIEIGCEPGKDNGIQQAIHLRVYQLLAGGLTIDSGSLNGLNEFKSLNETVHNRTNKAANRMNNMHNRVADSMNNATFHKTYSDLLLSDHHHLLSKHLNTIQHNNFIGQFNHLLSTCLETTHQQKESSVINLIANQSIAINQTNQYIRFRRINLSTSKQYLFIIFASNSRGNSEHVEWIFDSGIHQLVSRGTTLNYFQFVLLIGYFFVGILCTILLTYLLFTLALCFPFCLRLQLVIVNHRLLTSSRKQTVLPSDATMNEDRMLSMRPNSHSLNAHNVLNESTISRKSNIYTDLHAASNSLISKSNYKTEIQNQINNLNKNLTNSLTIDKVRLNHNLPYGINSINLTNSLPHPPSNNNRQYDNIYGEAIATNLVANENIYINFRNENDLEKNSLSKLLTKF